MEVCETIASDSQDDPLQQLVHQGHVQQVEGEEVAVENCTKDGAGKEYLKAHKTMPA